MTFLSCSEKSNAGFGGATAGVRRLYLPAGIASVATYEKSRKTFYDFSG